MGFKTHLKLRYSAIGELINTNDNPNATKKEQEASDWLSKSNDLTWNLDVRRSLDYYYLFFILLLTKDYYFFLFFCSIQRQTKLSSRQSKLATM